MSFLLYIYPCPLSGEGRGCSPYMYMTDNGGTMVPDEDMLRDQKQYRIRQAVPADEKRIRELFQEMLRTIYHTPDAAGYEDGYLDRFWAGSGDRIYVAEDEEVVGFLSVEVHHEPVLYLYLDDFSVTEAYRNLGIGTALIRTAESFAAEEDVSAVLLHVEKTNGSGMRLYERLGYSVFRDDGNRLLLKKDITDI